MNQEDIISISRTTMLWDAQHIFALVALVVAQPIFDLLGRYPEFLVAHHSGPTDILILAAILCFLIPAVLVSICWTLRLMHWRIYRIGYFFIVTILITAFLAQVLKSWENLPGLAVISVSALISLAFSWFIYRFTRVREFLNLLTIAIFIIPTVFLFISPVKKLILPETLSTTQVSTQSETPVVLIIFDELPVTSLMTRDHEIDRKRFPNFATLADRATWYRNATSLGSGTLIAVPAILSGICPDKPRLPSLVDYPNNLFTLLAPSYDMFVFEPYTQLCPEEYCIKDDESINGRKRLQLLLSDLTIVYLHLLLPNDLTANLPSISEDWRDFTGTDIFDADFDTDSAPQNAEGNKKQQRVITTQEAFHKDQKDRMKQIARVGRDDIGHIFDSNIELIQARERAAFYFQHIQLPHTPWRYLPSGKLYLNQSIDGFLKGNTWGENEWLVWQGFQRHLLQLGYVDVLLGRLLTRLSEQGLFDDALLIVTSDHGSSYRSGEPRRTLSQGNKVDIASIPLFIKFPKQKKGMISDYYAQTIDILPTIADVLNIDLPCQVDGHSLLDSNLPERETLSIFTTGNSRISISQQELAGRKRVMVMKERLFGLPANSVNDFFAMGPLRRLIGSPYSAYEVDKPSLLRAEIGGLASLQNINKDSDFLPARITGFVDMVSSETRFLPFALGMNETVVAVTESFPISSQRMKFTALLPEDSFKSGRNELALFHIVELPDSDLELRRVPINQEEVFSLLSEDDDGRFTLISSNGEQYASVPNERGGSMQGTIERIYVGDHIVTMAGWAMDLRNGSIPRSIVVLKDGQFFYSGKTSVRRTGALRVFGEAMEYCGFSFNFPIRSLPTPGEGQLRWFAIGHDHIATELIYPDEYTWREPTPKAIDGRSVSKKEK